MEGSSSRVSDFSIDRILSPQLGPCCYPEPLYGLRPQQVPLLPLELLPYGATRGHCGYADLFCPCSAGLHHHPEFTGVYPNPNLNPRVACRQGPPDAAQVSHYHGHQDQHHQHHQQQQQHQVRQKARMRTVFSEEQSSQLEALFQRSDYPAVEARAELARSSGLSEETVRVWFKNRRARRKRQGCESKVKLPSPPRSFAPQSQIFNTVL